MYPPDISYIIQLLLLSGISPWSIKLQCLRLLLLVYQSFQYMSNPSIPKTFHLLDSSSAQITPKHPPDRLRIVDSVFKYLKYYGPSSTDVVSITTSRPNHDKLLETCTSTCSTVKEGDAEKIGEIWMKMIEEARFGVEQEPILTYYYSTSILSHNSLQTTLASHLSIKLSNSGIPINTLYDIYIGVLKEDQEIVEAVKKDLKAVKQETQHA